MGFKSNMYQHFYFLLVAAASLATSLSTLTLCPTNTTSSPALCVQDINGGLPTVVTPPSSTANSTTMVLDPTTILDLSGHDLQSIASVPPEQWPRLTTLNLSHNVLMSVDDVLKNLPPTIEVLCE
ncbi:Aste57867_17480 [Aphanomyces stellatus]|uniref:Aste57867_17480 protein n=1 Tax=Aphanomyces stellatus TaxID=120398 RepID=A0A485L8R0_9STRA|nr:hypothetical protein As57867_017420 [Aphanomyces stellatus]VFT94233.1 Aste57867_17480 [Aphanomyces stellatus]